jgi:uncharacterized protein YybS (DUF2232 family)
MYRRSASIGLVPALAAGVSLGLFFIPWLLPVLGALISIWSPLPLALLYWRQGNQPGRRGMLLAGAGAVAVYWSLPTGLTGLYYFYYAAVAMVLGEAARQEWAPERSIALAAAAGALAALAVFILGGAFSGQGLGQVWESYWQGEVDLVLGIYGQNAMETGAGEQLRRSLMETGRVIMRLAPGVLAAATLLMAWANFLFARSLARRGSFLSAVFGQSLALFKAPERLVWIFIAAAGLMVIAEGWWYWLGANLVVILSVVYFFQGLAIIAHWLEKKKAPRLLRAGIYVLVAMEFFLAVFVAAAGLFDLWFDFRRLKKQNSA